MKKLLSLLLTVSFILCLSSHAFSDTSETEYNWSEVQSVVQEVFSENSKFFLIEEIESSFWTPSFYHIADLSEEEIQDNCIGYLLTEDGSSFILLYYMDMPVDSLDAFFAFYRQNGNNAQMVTVNGIPAILVRDTATDSLSVSFQTQEGKLFQMICYPISDESFSIIFDLIIASITPIAPVVVEDTSETDAPVPTNPISGLISK